MNSSAYHLLAVIQAKDTHKINEIRMAISTLIQHTLQEPGCLQFNIKESAETTGLFYLWESWKNKQALDTHYNEIHTQAYFSKKYTEIISITPLNSLSVDSI